MEDFEDVRIATANALGLDESHQSWFDIRREVEYAEIREKYHRSDSFGKIVLLIKILMNDFALDYGRIESFMDAIFCISVVLNKSQNIVACSSWKPSGCYIYGERKSLDWWTQIIARLEELYEELKSDEEDQERVLEILQSLPCNREHYYYCD